MTRSKKRLLSAVVSLVLVVSLSAPAFALGEIDLTKEGVVTLGVASNSADGTLDQTETNPYQLDLAEAVTDVSVYKLAAVTANGLFTLQPGFEELSEVETWNGGMLNAATKLQDLSDKAEEVLGLNAPAEGETPPEGEAAPAAPAVAPTVYEGVQVVGGRIELGADLGLGLFLLVPEKVETEEWVYTFSPVLLAVPSIEREEGVTDDGEWQYEVPVTMKPEREPRLTDIEIDKTLEEYNATLGPTTFVFEVRAEKPAGTVVYSNVVYLTFTGTGTKSVTASGIPVGSTVTVTELDTGTSYHPSDGKVSVPIEKLPVPEGEGVNRVGFTNEYTGERIPDSSVVNVYTYNGKGWSWHQEVAGEITDRGTDSGSGEAEG